MANYGMQRDDDQPTVKPQKVDMSMSPGRILMPEEGSDDATRAGVIPRMMSYETESLSALEDGVHALEDRLQPLLSPPPGEKSPLTLQQQDRPEMSEHARVIDDNIDRIRRLRYRLNDLMDRLEF